MFAWILVLVLIITTRPLATVDTCLLYTSWETNIFGKSIEQLVQDGIRSKLTSIGEESQSKLQDTMQKIVNDSKGGMVCIII